MRIDDEEEHEVEEGFEWREELDGLARMIREWSLGSSLLTVDEDDPTTAPPAASLIDRVLRAVQPKATALTTATTSPHASAQAYIDDTIERACRVASCAILEGEDSTTEAERARIDHVLSTLYYINQAVRAALLAERILVAGPIKAAAAAASARRDARRRKRGGGRGGRGGRGGGRDRGDEDEGRHVNVDGIAEGDPAAERRGQPHDDVLIGDDDLAAGLARFSRLESEDANRMQQLLLYLLNCAQQRGYRRMGADMYQRVLTHQGHDTHAWEVACSVQDFVYECTRKEINYDMWLALTGARVNLGAAIEHLINCRDVQLPDLVKDRHVFSFSDGIYLAAEDRFVRYVSTTATATARTAEALPGALVAAKYFDRPFAPAACVNSPPDDWQKAIPTPLFQSILDFQNMDDEVSRWMYVMVGRLIYDVGELDGWQVIPYLRGAASSGKSTILTQVCRAFYERADVGVLSNNIERKFGLSALWDKLLFIGPEIKGDIALEQAEFQSMVSGETVQVAIKNKTARTVDWAVPGILAGNEVPSWVDNSGSINRRIVLFEFPKRVHNADMELGKKLKDELPRIILKANRAYLQAVRLHARQNVWKHLPAAFHSAKDDFSAGVNSFVHFLRSGELEFGEGLYMPAVDLHSMYGAHVAQYGLKRILSLNSNSSLQGALDPFGCLYCGKEMSRPYPRGGRGMRKDKYVLGCDRRKNTDGEAGYGGGDDPEDDGLDRP